jgi:serine phosphatase RsbU (regulator of sigma subunit)
MYNQSIGMFINDFRGHKLSVARFVATSIDGDKHEKFQSLKDFKNPDFKQYYRIIRNLHLRESDIHYIYTLNYNSEEDELYYAIDTDEAEYSTVWIESGDFSFKVFAKEENLLYQYSNKIYEENKSFSDIDGNKLQIQIINQEGKTKLLLANQEIFQVKSWEPFIIETKTGALHTEQRDGTATINIAGKLRTFSLSFTDRGSPGSDPGAVFIEDFELKEKVKKLIRTKTDYIDLAPIENSYGTFLGAYAVILNSKGEAKGIAVVDINASKIDEFKKKFTIVALTTSLIVFVLISIVSILLAKYFTLPLELLAKAVETLASGNLESYVEIESKDEFGKLAKSFNVMVTNLKIASEVQYNLLIEITQLNENLEQKVKERTKKIEEQSSEIEKQILITRKIQLSLLPDEIPIIKNASVSFKYQPMMGVGGDFLDFDYRDDGELKLFICDVSGHGIPAAFLATMVKMALQDCYELRLDPVESITKIHRALIGKMKGHFLSAIFCQINLETGLMRTANAGHLPLIHLKEKGEAVFFSSQGRIINELFPPKPVEQQLQLESGDKIILYTDGVTESRNSNLEMYGEERLIQLLTEKSKMNTSDICKSIYNSVLEFTENSQSQFADDITILTAEYKKEK